MHQQSPIKTKQTYNWLSRHFHWLMGALIFVIFALGWTMTQMELSQIKLTLYAWHKWLGIIILALACCRLLWRLVSKTPTSNNPNVPYVFHLAAKIGHIALYICLFALPVIGWLRSSTAGFQVVLFKKIPLPDLLNKNEGLSEQLSEIHETLALIFAVLIIGHVAAVIIHHWIFKDQILQHMKPSWYHRALIFLSLLVGSALYINFQIVNPPPKMVAAKKDRNLTNDQGLLNKKKETIPGQTEWLLESANSQLEFIATQMGAKTTGEFKKFTIIKLIFNPNEPEKAEVEIEIEINSLSIGNPLIGQTLTSSQWFDAEAFPKAYFNARNFKFKGDNIYHLTGELNIKDITKPISLLMNIDFTAATDGSPARLKAKGEVNINRLSYKIGQGEWASTESLNETVQLKIHISAIKAR